MKTIQFVRTGLYINQLVPQVDLITYYVGNDKREISRYKNPDGTLASTRDSIIRYENYLQLLRVLDTDNENNKDVFQFDRVFSISIHTYSNYQQSICRELV